MFELTCLRVCIMRECAIIQPSVSCVDNDFFSVKQSLYTSGNIMFVYFYDDVYYMNLGNMKHKNFFLGNDCERIKKDVT